MAPGHEKFWGGPQIGHGGPGMDPLDHEGEPELTMDHQANVWERHQKGHDGHGRIIPGHGMSRA
ncbi:MAG: hypothetical protein CM15mP3_04990 [Candidatus Poseidoniales archaeon]|nr:MAG: hypothetical protein CM15mP3_04990 [Candidatus Poseidoniales archaeon]